jgi:HD superfamily phosphohydrolase
MRLPVSGNAPFTTRISRVYDSAPVKRLSNHRQLGSIYQVYRGAIHTRLEHAEGVLCTTCDYVRALFADQTNPFWRVNIRRRDIELLLFAALVHDIGHVAFGHFIEELEGLLRGRKHERYLLAVLEPPLFNQDVPWAKSADITADRIGLSAAIIEGWGPTTETDASAFMRDVARILQPIAEQRIQFDEAAIYDRDACESIKMHVLHSILDSAIDADKFDYLLRDALHSGVRYANGIDDDRFLQTLTVISDFAKFQKPAEGEPTALRPCIGVSQKGIQPLETVLIARYQMFRSVYWHHTARAQTAMLHFLIVEHLIATIRIPAKGDEASRLLDRALDRLLRQYRTRDDDGAIIWLRKQIKDSIDDQQTKEKLMQICDCLLGNRDHLYHEVFELGYDKAHAETRYSLYKSLSDWSQEINSQTEDGVAYLEAIRAKRRSLTDALTARLEIELRNGDILLDVPPAGKDQIDNVYVHFGDEIRSIYDVSPMGQAVRETFAKWTRSVRVFFHPAALERCLKNGMTLRKLQIECKAALDEIQDQQQRLNFPGSAT